MTQCVYFIQAEGGGPIKIGTAKNLKGRLKTLQTGSGSKLVVLAQRDGGQEIERQIHNLLKPHRLHGEWFSPNPEVLEAVESAKKGTPLPEVNRVAVAKDRDFIEETGFMAITFSAVIVAAYGQEPGWRRRAADDAGVTVSCVSQWVDRVCLPNVAQIFNFARRCEAVKNWWLALDAIWAVAKSLNISVIEAAGLLQKQPDIALSIMRQHAGAANG